MSDSSHMFLLQKIAFYFFALVLGVSILSAQIPVPNRDNKSNPYSGNPNRSNVPPAQTRQELSEQEEAQDSVFDQRVYSDIFSTALPSIFREGEWRIRLNPKFGDFFDDDNVRFPIGVEYNFSDYFEGFVDVGTYFPNPFNSGGSWGTYNLREYDTPNARPSRT